MDDSIYALSSGSLPSGVATIRISGPQSRCVVETMCSDIEFGAPVSYCLIKHPKDNKPLDAGLVLTFVGPASYTGEDIIELQVHGGKAVVDGLLDALGELDHLRPAEPGEFTYRAVINGKIDLTQAEGIGDLIASESESQRLLALNDVRGEAREQIEQWSRDLLRMRAFIEAEIDFVEEDDVPGSVSDQVWQQAADMALELEKHLASSHKGEVIRDGFKITLLGKPNSGKSTLLNCLARREVAIVSEEPGTTRDVIEVKLNIDGHLVYVSDTAGIRDTLNDVEQEGIRRARSSADEADLTIWLHGADDREALNFESADAGMVLITKSELKGANSQSEMKEHAPLSISVFENTGIDELLGDIKAKIQTTVGLGGARLFGNKRQSSLIKAALTAVSLAAEAVDEPLEIRAENLRIAAHSLGRISGMTDTEDVLGVIFSEFCVGK